MRLRLGTKTQKMLRRCRMTPDIRSLLPCHSVMSQRCRFHAIVVSLDQMKSCSVDFFFKLNWLRSKSMEQTRQAPAPATGTDLFEPMRQDHVRLRSSVYMYSMTQARARVAARHQEYEYHGNVSRTFKIFFTPDARSSILFGRIGRNLHD